MNKPNISSIDLILLGLIRNEPHSAYDLSKMLGVYELVKISIPAIYKNIKRLQKNGYLKFSIEKKSNMPEKKIYSITKSGEARFFELLELCTKNTINYFFDFNVSLLFLGSIDKGIGNKLVNSVKENLTTKQQDLNKQIEMFQHLPFPIPNLGKQHLELNRTMLGWIKELEKNYDT